MPCELVEFCRELHILLQLCTHDFSYVIAAPIATPSSHCVTKAEFVLGMLVAEAVATST